MNRYRVYQYYYLLCNIIILLFIAIIIFKLTYSKTVLENPLKIKPQPAALDFQNLA